MFALGHRLFRALQTLDKSDLVPRTGGQTAPGRLGDDGPQLEAVGDGKFLSFAISSSLSTLPKTAETPSGHTAVPLISLPATKALRLALSLGAPGPAAPWWADRLWL